MCVCDCLLIFHISHSSTRNRHPDTQNDNVFFFPFFVGEALDKSEYQIPINSSKTTDRLTGYSSGSSAVVKSHDVQMGDFSREAMRSSGSIGPSSTSTDSNKIHRQNGHPGASRIFKGRWFQLIKWQGFEDPLWNTWIPAREV
ncbi:hypothetical protein B9Z55_007848 [Caenorhabditis nigoni]|nr:hypothetical protein B9Z55_007848 [Caenorhabditis nigoni]